jgi:hypothetical protein
MRGPLDGRHKETSKHWNTRSSFRQERASGLFRVKRSSSVAVMRLHNPLTTEQLAFAASEAVVAEVGFYHGGASLYLRRVRSPFTLPSRTETASLAAHCRPVDLVVTAAVIAADMGAATGDPDQIVYKG